MSTTQGWGLAAPLPGLTVAEHVDFAAELPDLGIDGLWCGESVHADAFALLAAAAVRVGDLALGTAVVPVGTRGPGLLAMAAATLCSLAPGRFTLGVGASSPAVVSDWNARPYDTPLAQTRDTLRFLRESLAGERVDTTLESFAVRGFRLVEAPEMVPPLLCAALRPRMLHLAAEEADGVVLTCVSPDDVRAIRGELSPVREDWRVLTWVTVCPTDDPERARRAARRTLVGYLTTPAYAAAQEWLGRGELLRPVREAWARGHRREALAALPDALVDELVVHGSPAECRARLARFRDAGATDLAVTVLPDGDPRQAVRSLAAR